MRTPSTSKLENRSAPMRRSIGSDPVGSASANLRSARCVHAELTGEPRGTYLVSDGNTYASVENVGPRPSRQASCSFATCRHVPAEAQPTAEMDVDVLMRRSRSDCTTRSATRVTSEPWSSRALTCIDRPDAELTRTWAVASKTGDGVADEANDARATTGAATVEGAASTASTVAAFEFVGEGESTWSIVWCLCWHVRQENLL